MSASAGDGNLDRACEASRLKLRRYRATQAEVRRRRAALYDIFEDMQPMTLHQLWELPTQPTNQADSRAKRFMNVSVELEPIQPALLRELVRLYIEGHSPQDELRTLKGVKESEPSTVPSIVNRLAGDRR